MSKCMSLHAGYSMAEAAIKAEFLLLVYLCTSCCKQEES